jgi:alpha-tubulin suppressor-like RCC1 family protein
MGDVHGRLATGLDFACALDSSNEFVCWGRGLPYEAPPGAYTMLAAGSIRVCLLDQAGALLCLPEEQHDLPQGTFQSVCVGGYLSCAIDSASALVCWTSPGNELDERLIPPTGTFREVSCGQVHACAIRVDGTVTCWGIDSFGETVAPSGQFEHVAVGPSGSCGIQSGTREVQCWGDATAAPLPGRPVVRITRGYSDAASLGFGCAVDEDDQLVCWGTVEGATDAPTGSFRTVTANDNHACAAAPDGTVTCWGDLLGWADVPADLRLF